MDIASRKLHLIEQLMGIVNPDRMERFEKFFKSEFVDTTDVWDELPEVVQQLVDKGLRDVANGNVRSHEDVMADIRKEYSFIK